jgi:putative transcriptional regulator
MLNNIKKLRTDLNMTQEELAQLANVRRETIVFLEQGRYNPSLSLANSVAKALKEKIDKVFILE